MSNFNSPINKLNTTTFTERLNNKYPDRFEVLSEYINSTTSIQIRCKSCGHIFNIRPSSLLSRGRCPNCSKINKKPRINTWNKLTNEDFLNKLYELVGDEYSALSEYTKAEDYIIMRHNTCGFVWNVQARNFISPSQMSRCPKCMKFHSNQEEDLYNFVKSIYKGNIIRQDRKTVYPQELDIYIPEKKVALEYNGTYWHSSLFKDKTYHYNKSKLCEEKNIRLIHIFEYEWNNARQRPILENIIKNALGLNNNKIFARKCKIVIKESKDMKEFFNQNNIQGFRGGHFAICLEYNNEIVMSYIIGKAFFGKGKYQYEVIRGATKLGYTVVGGASKIWKYFIENYNPESCVYYIDYNYFNGNSLPYLGLEFLKTQYGYKNYFIETGEIKNRDPLHHKEIKELEKQGLVIPIYNAGTKVYIWTRK